MCNLPNALRTLEQHLADTDAALLRCQQDLETSQREHGQCLGKRQYTEEMRQQCLTTMQTAANDNSDEYFAALEGMREAALKEHTLTVESCDGRERDMREWLQAKIESERARLSKLRDRIIHTMSMFRNRWPAASQEVDVSLEAIGDYRQILERLLGDDLPQFEERFKALLNENTIREIASFQGQLHREAEAIRERIGAINQSLRSIEYNDGRYIMLLCESSADADVRDFRQKLRACTEGALTGSDDEQYSEQKFLQVKEIIERFRGREGLTEIDRRWTRKVTDVRHWFVFSASERWFEDHTEHEHYADSGGKSGGQKEKLAYTVLAASLAYQFGLDAADARLRTFRFVVIDEAFGRGSDKSARFGLQLFKKLSLQVLIVTPLQKVHVIEPFVASVGFVHNRDGNCSMLRNLTIQEYHAEKAAKHRIVVAT